MKESIIQYFNGHAPDENPVLFKIVLLVLESQIVTVEIKREIVHELKELLICIMKE